MLSFNGQAQDEFIFWGRHKMVDKGKMKGHKKLTLAGMVISSILINGGFFPIINFNPNNPVDLGIMLRLAIIAVAISSHIGLGTLQAAILSKWPATFIGLLNVFLVLCGLICRYLLEFGEVSNTYSFTILNVSFQVITLAFMSTVACLSERRKG